MKMNNKIYNYIFGSLVGLMNRKKIDPITNYIIDQIDGNNNLSDIERIVKGILVNNVDEDKERQAVRVAKDVSIFIYNNSK